MRALRKAKTVRTMPILAPPSIAWRPACYHEQQPMARNASPCDTALTEFSGGKAGGRLYVTCEDGAVRCFGEGK